jgi:hypothetical protein
MAEPNEKALIGGSKSETLEQSRTDWNQNNRNKDREKGAIVLHCCIKKSSGWFGQGQGVCNRL